MRSIALVVLLLVCVPSLLPAQNRPVLSPRDSVLLISHNDSLLINYGRPSIRGRVIMGKLVPWGEVWRTGANQATHLKTNFDLTLGGVPVPKGTYTLWTLPSEKGWKMILNKQTGQWGTVYNARLDLARFDATVETLPAVVDTFRITLAPTKPGAGTLALEWEKTRISVPFEKNDHIRPLSPPDSAEIALGNQHVKIVYSRPFARGRAIWGTVVPFDSVWRTGANAATRLTADAPIHLGSATLKAGSYVIRSIPSGSGTSLLISTQPATPNGNLDSLIVARVPASMSPSGETIDPFRIWFVPDGAGQAILKLGWADREYSVRVTKE